MLERLQPAPALTELADKFINATLHPAHNITFADGTSNVNNHMDGAYEEVHDPALKDQVTAHAAQLVYVSEGLFFDGVEADFIAPVPYGATGWAYAVARSLKRPSLQILNLEKVERRVFSTNSFSERQIESLLSLGRPARGIVLDDVAPTGGTAEAMANWLKDIGLETNLILTMLFRGDIQTLKSEYNRAFVMNTHVPHMLDWDTWNNSKEIKELSS